MRPLIGVTTSELRPSHLATLRHADPPRSEMALGTTYAQAVAAAGGIPVVLPPVDAELIEHLLDRLDGICLSGGPDLDPVAYGAHTRHPELGPTAPVLDDYELALARAADTRALPLLGVCRGAQALNVARGGTLHQHVDGHRQAEAATTPTHPVKLAPGSRLAQIAGVAELAVNSFHHQAVHAPGTGLRIVGRSPDGGVEAIEDPVRPFMLGVQWHVETLVDHPAHGAVFDALIAAAAGGERRALRAA
jgi:putative glutamine amidotransferase